MIHSQKGLPGLLNQINRSRIFRVIRDFGCTSRSIVSNETGLSIPTVSGAVDYLESKGLVACEDTGQSTRRGGRPPGLIRFPAEKNLAVGLDLDKHISHLILADLNAKIIHEEHWKTPGNYDELIYKTTGKIRKCIRQVSKDAYFRGTGIAIAGLVDRKKGVVDFSRSMSWQNVDFSSIIRDRIKSPVFIDNEANLLALGELYYGMGNKYRNLMCIDIRCGIGCGIIHNHRLLDIPAELGQISIVPSEHKESLFPLTTLEDIASDSAMVKIAKEKIRDYPGDSMLKKRVGDLTPEVFIKAVRKGDGFAITIFEEALSELGLVLSGMVNIFHPEALIFHGPISRENPVFFSRLKEIIQSYALTPLTGELDLYPSSFGKHGVAIGSVSLILHELLNLNSQILNV